MNSTRHRARCSSIVSCTPRCAIRLITAFVPHTLGEDGDPLDALVVARSPIVAGAVVKCRPVGVLMMEDDAGGDEKLLCVPVNKTFPYYADVVTYKDMPPIVLQQIEHFFTHYKDLEPGKWAKLNGWGDVDEAKRIIMECVERAKEHGV
jgi:inorganic pyrophosphatase